MHNKYCFILTFFSLFLFSQEETLPQWQEGMLDIHHINTGRGDAAFAVFPDGTTMLIDAGDMSDTHPRSLSVRNAKRMPNSSRTAPEWIVDYIKQFFPEVESKKLDYALITHYHDDHFGEMDTLRKKHSKGGYGLTGMMEVGSLIPIKNMLDRGSEFPINLKAISVQEQHKNDKYRIIQTLNEYWKFIDYQSKTAGLKHDSLVVGSNTQIALKLNPEKYPRFSVRNIASNGVIWTGNKTNTQAIYAKGDYPGENPLSNCIKISYGKFNYFTGGDISGIDAFGGTDINSLESQIAPVIGPVDIATLNHHGNRDSQNVFYVRTVRPRVWIQQNWSSDHPGEEVLRRITSKQLYSSERDVFSTVMLQPNKDVIGAGLDDYKSQKGHIVARVYNSGKQYKIYILNDASIEREVLAIYGPYESK